MTKADDRVQNTKVARRISFVTETDPNVVITCEGEADDPNSPGEPIMIRPVTKSMIRRRVSASISVDLLEPQERDLYLRDYLPPNSNIRHRAAKNHVIHARQIGIRRRYSSQARKEPWHACQTDLFIVRRRQEEPTLTLRIKKEDIF